MEKPEQKKHPEPEGLVAAEVRRLRRCLLMGFAVACTLFAIYVWGGKLWVGYALPPAALLFLVMDTDGPLGKWRKNFSRLAKEARDEAQRDRKP